jgi:hypothetical protein
MVFFLISAFGISGQFLKFHSKHTLMGSSSYILELKLHLIDLLVSFELSSITKKGEIESAPRPLSGFW